MVGASVWVRTAALAVFPEVKAKRITARAKIDPRIWSVPDLFGKLRR